MYGLGRQNERHPPPEEGIGLYLGETKLFGPELHEFTGGPKS